MDQLITFLRSSFDPPTIYTNCDSQSEPSALQPTTQPSNTSQSLSLLKEFCSNEDTIKKYLLHDELDSLDNEQKFISPMDTLGPFIQNWFTLYGQKNLSVNPIDISSTVPSPISPCTTSDPLIMSTFCRSQFKETYDNLKLNFIRLVERGYKLTLSLDTEDSEVDVPWNSDVSKKILSVYFSSLSLRSEFLSDDNELDGFESLLMAEACAAFKGQKNLNLFANMADRRQAKASPDKLISICNGIKGYRKIEINDKIILLCSIYNNLEAMDAIINYDPTIDGWDAPASDVKYDRRDVFIFSQFLHDGIVHVIETFTERLRNDINVIILTYLIIIFNPDEPKLKYPEIIRHEQYSYIYLLRRYLRTVYKSDCEASENLYRLMVKIEQLKLIADQTKKDFFLLLNEPLVETIKRAVEFDNSDI